ncbi:hypothetical protein [Mesorhizobium sp.]
MQLFERKHSGVRPTLAGECFMRDAAIGLNICRERSMR